MQENKISLASDNCSPTHPAILQAIIEANDGFAPSYGADAWTAQAERLIQSAFQRPCKVFFVPTGTGANIFGLKVACKSHESIICTNIAHINYQESGAPESIIGCKLLPVPHVNGKITPDQILKRLRSERAFGKHSTRPRAVSIAQSTEFGTVYTLEELQGLSQLCADENLIFHVDGSRLYNAAVHLNLDLHQMFDSLRVDLLSLGGTKNGLLAAEALVIFNPSLHDGSDYLQKQTLQLLSKMRFLSAQYIPFFKDNLWRTLAKQANQKAREIATIIENTPLCCISYPVQTNQIFFTIPPSWIQQIQKEVSCLLWDQETHQIRFIASWNTDEQTVKAIQTVFAKISQA